MMVYSKYNRKPKPRRRRANHDSRRAGLYFLVITTTIVILLKVATWLNAGEMFEFRSVSITGTQYVDDRELLRLAQIDTTLGLFELDLKAIAQRVKTHPLVAEAVVSRRLPSTLIIHVTEKKPLAILNLQQLHAIDARGTILASLTPERLFDLPVIMNVQLENKAVLQQILAFLSHLKRYQFSLYSEISEISYSDKAGIYFRLVHDSIPVILGPGNFARKGEQFSKVLAIMKSQNKLSKVRYFDLRFDNQVVVKHTVKS